jgi:hypothetical protein
MQTAALSHSVNILSPSATRMKAPRRQRKLSLLRDNPMTGVGPGETWLAIAVPVVVRTGRAPMKGLD